ncbi:MAG: DUF1002 domain-containing protein [Eubacterium sp.]|nr:DUF1002 domain-containing protein [Eubacterium sp.]MCI8919054.1 DUF1002 domain-containing protein [Eubacterium sp.]
MVKKWKNCIALMLAGMLTISAGTQAAATSTDQLEGSFADDTSLDDMDAEDGAADDGQETDGDDISDSGGEGENGSKVGDITTEIVQGDGPDEIETEIIQDPADDDNVVIAEDDKPYLALGADLTNEQKNTVLGLMGIDPASLEDYHVVTVTNEEEHQYLDDYMNASTIGTRALSSVVIVKRDKGDGIHISTKNISYCTVGMYKNALATAGLEDADVIVAGPFRLSGTAALIGAMKAYADMEDKELDAESLDAAMNEIVVTGELNSSLGGEAQTEEFIAYVKQKVVEGSKDLESIKKVIADACKKFDITLSDSEKEQIVSLMEKIGSLDINIDSLLKQAGSIYESLANMEDKSGILAGIASFFKGIFESIVSFFKGLF